MKYEKLTTRELKTGDIIITRYGAKGIVVKEFGVVVYSSGGFDFLSTIIEPDSLYTIERVYRPKESCHCSFSYPHDDKTLFYDVGDVPEMTLEEVCAALGKKIRIVEDKNHED